MAEFTKLIITNRGKSLIGKMLTGGTDLDFTKIAVSSTNYESEDLEGLMELSNVQQSNTIVHKEITEENAVKLETTFTNQDLTEGYYVRTIGLYANDPDVGEILYAVTSETSGNCYMPAYSGVTISGLAVTLVTAIENAENVSLEVKLDPSAAEALLLAKQYTNTLIGDLDDLSTAESNNLVAAINEAVATAKGRCTGHVFDTYEDLVAWVADANNTAMLNLGDNLYIRAINVPDYWWDGSTIQQLETQKVNLENYASTEDIPTKTSQLINDSGYVTANNKVTNTLATTTKAYVTGTTSASTNTGTQVFDTGVYLDTTAGKLVATTFSGALSGNATTATTATTATKLGSATVGGSAKPIYLKSGTATACSSTIGSATKPVYMNAGTITACTSIGTVLTATLDAGSTSVSFVNEAITSDSTIDIYTDVYGVNPTNVSVSGTTLTITFDAQADAVSVKVRIM